MSDDKAIRKWSELQHIRVFVPSTGRSMGTVEDFYFKPASTGIDGLLVRTRLGDTLFLPTSSIQEFQHDAIIIANEQMLGKRPSPFPLGSSLIGNKVQDEKGNDLGTIGEIFIGTEPPIATRVISFELTSNGHGRPKGFTSDAVINYQPNLFVIQNQISKRLR